MGRLKLGCEAWEAPQSRIGTFLLNIPIHEPDEVRMGSLDVSLG